MRIRKIIGSLVAFVAMLTTVIGLGVPSTAQEDRPAGGAVLNGTVTTASDSSSDGSPVVRVNLFAASAGGSRTSFLGAARVPDVGDYSFSVDGGCYVVVAIAPYGETFTNGSRFSQSHRCVGDGQTVTLPAVAINASRSGSNEVTIGGQVGVRGGEAAAGVGLNLFAAQGDGSRGSFLARTETDGSGRYRFVTAPGCYVVVTIAPTGQNFVNGGRFSEQGVCLRRGAATSDINAVLDGGGGSPATTAAPTATTSTRPPTSATGPTTTAANGSTTTTTTAARPTPAPTTAPTTTTSRAATSTSTTAGSRQAPGLTSAFGFSPGGWFADEPDDKLYADFDRMAAAGATWFRIDFDWSEIERNKGTYHWHRTDRVIEAARSRGIQVVGLITESPAWARSAGTSSYSPPNNPDEYARFAAAVVERYGPRGVTTYELWNEPNLGMFWGPNPNPERYAALVKPAGNAMRAVRGDLTILSGGLAPAADEPDGSGISPTTFTRRMLQAGAGAVFDGYAIHPFSYPARPIDASTAEWNPFHNLPAYRDLLASHGQGGKLIWLTEYGAPTGTSSRAVSEAEQSAQIQEALTIASGWSWTGPILLYAHRDSRQAPSDFQSNFGLINHDGTPKRAWHDLMARGG